ncbi:hypothetical protein ABID26_003995 [Mesorhizobium shonense]|uniref:DUF4102 domain-containing protein n=1 Tax=Mesorhizobium shonense TaxID=1209948 RepID=A0ABV2HWU7_9HYPH|nr:hypothetical protein [Mesorhizobium sp.]TIS47548.1 MAG: DUF4102 domain-containing protein [Mesorhizobium sp.]
MFPLSRVLSDGGNLYLQVTRSGTKQWVFFFQLVVDHRVRRRPEPDGRHPLAVEIDRAFRPQERRFSVVDTDLKSDHAYYAALIEAVGDEKKELLGTEVPAFFDHLVKIDLTELASRHLQTVALQDQRLNTEA